jgi:glycosyltransferase involved in cell wall biosynthesis
MPQLYHDHDVLLFPSVWAEPFGLVPLEAMAASCVVVATGTGGSADFLRGGDNCLLVPAQDPDAIVAAIRRLRGDPGLVARLRRGGRATLAAHSFDAYAAGLEEQLAALIDSWSPASSASRGGPSGR